MLLMMIDDDDDDDDDIGNIFLQINVEIFSMIYTGNKDSLFINNIHVFELS